jgi:hypothetical protein
MIGLCSMRCKWPLLILTLAPAILLSEYAPKELFTIPWGDGANELKATPTRYEGIISDSTDYDFEPGHGPSAAFVDKKDNIIILSHDFYQLKGFDNIGNLIFNLSKGETTLDTSISSCAFSDIYIDTSFQIYLTSSPEMVFVPIINYNGKIINKIFPYNDSDALIFSMSWSNASILTFFCATQGFATYSNGYILPVGSYYFIAKNGFYYISYIDDESGAFTFIKGYNPNKWGYFEWADTASISISADSIYLADLLNGGDGDYLYVYVDFYKGQNETYGVWIFDFNYNLLDTISVPFPKGFYDYNINPFVARDGSIYEFRVQDDGLHVINWTKK